MVEFFSKLGWRHRSAAGLRKTGCARVEVRITGTTTGGVWFPISSFYGLICLLGFGSTILFQCCRGIIWVVAE